MIRKTKIVATIGPASSSKEKLKALINAGLNVCRINFSHGGHDIHLKTIENIRAVSEELKFPVAILGDLQGPKLRVGTMPDDGLELKDGEEIVFTTQEVEMGSKTGIYMSYENFPRDAKKGESLSLIHI